MAKVSRWVRQLSDGEVVELTHRLLRALSRTSDVDAGALRSEFLRFIEDYPQQRLAEKEAVT